MDRVPMSFSRWIERRSDLSSVPRGILQEVWDAATAEMDGTVAQLEVTARGLDRNLVRLVSAQEEFLLSLEQAQDGSTIERARKEMMRVTSEVKVGLQSIEARPPALDQV